MGWQTQNRRISVLVDNDSWILPYAEQLVADINQCDDQAALYREHESLPEGFACFLLGCVKIAAPETLARHRYNLVVHESNLPEGRGFAPMTWQILEGKNTIDFCLLEATEGEADCGDVFLRRQLHLEGHELCDELRDLQGKMTAAMVKEFLASPGEPEREPQQGKPSYYQRRRPEDSALDIHQTIEEQFNLLRVVDNRRYPAFFDMNGIRYKINITKMEDET